MALFGEGLPHLSLCLTHLHPVSSHWTPPVRGRAPPGQDHWAQAGVRGVGSPRHLSRHIVYIDSRHCCCLADAVLHTDLVVPSISDLDLRDCQTTEMFRRAYWYRVIWLMISFPSLVLTWLLIFFHWLFSVSLWFLPPTWAHQYQLITWFNKPGHRTVINNSLHTQCVKTIPRKVLPLLKPTS